jgi:hypothetical protein
MSTFQTTISIVLLVYILSVIVQAIQEILKAVLRTKAGVMEQIIQRFMGDHLDLDQVKGALKVRGLQITDLESFDKDSFRHLLDGISFRDQQLQNLLASAQATQDEVKDHIAASYEAARGAFQAAYTRKNKLFVLAGSFVVVILLNANIIFLYDQISVDSVAQQTLLGQVQKIELPKAQEGDLTEVYSKSREQIGSALEQYPILMRTSKYQGDFTHPVEAMFGLLMMGALVSLGAPFWNDVLKSMAQINSTLTAPRT